jgi:hypothetical protein
MIRAVKSLFTPLAMAAAFAASLGAAAEASVLKWTLNGPLRPDQTTDPITGSFLFDTTTEGISAVGFVSPLTSPSGGLTFDRFLGETFSGLAFVPSTSSTTAFALVMDGVRISGLSTPGTLALSRGGFAEVTCTSADCDAVVRVTNWDDGATLTGEVVSEAAVIPVPAALPLAASAFAMMGLMRLRRRARG